MNKFTFREVDNACLDLTHEAWMSFIQSNEENVSSRTYEAFLASSRKSIPGNAPQGDSPTALYGVFSDGAAVASALVTLVHARPKSQNPWLKLMDVYVEPSLDVAQAEPNVGQLAWIAATAVTGALALTYDVMGAKELKIWANVPMTKEFVTAVSTALFDGAFVVGSHGNWLIVTRNGEMNVAH